MFIRLLNLFKGRRLTQKHEKIRVISATVNGDRFAVTEWRSNVQIWDINSGLISKLETDIVSGMKNAISISEDGKQLVIAGYENKTVTLFEVESGKIIWQRRDISKPATALILNQHSNLIYIDTERQGSYFLDRNNGDTIEKLRGIKFIRENPYSTVDQFQKSSTSTIINRVNRHPIKSFTHKHSLLDACFSQDKIICAFSTNPLAAISLSNCEIVWSTNVIGHFLEIEYSKELNKILGIRWEYENGSPKYLCYVNIESGKVEKELNLGEPIKIEFLKQGSLILTSQGKIISTRTGQQIKQFNFENL